MSKKSGQQLAISDQLSAVSDQRYRAKENITLLAENVTIAAGEKIPEDLSAERIQTLKDSGLIEEIKNDSHQPSPRMGEEETEGE
jgi:hypothetical protein